MLCVTVMYLGLCFLLHVASFLFTIYIGRHFVYLLLFTF